MMERSLKTHSVSSEAGSLTNQDKQLFNPALFVEDDPNPLIRLAPDGKVLYANPAVAGFLRDLNRPAHQAELLLPDDFQKRLEAVRTSGSGRDTWEYPLGDRVFSCEIHYLTAYGVFQAYLLDVTERKRAEEMLFYQTYHDALTGLPNRYLFEENLQQALWSTQWVRRKDPHQVGVFLLSPDRFEGINSALGHDIGDQLLGVVAKRLQTEIQETNLGICCRMYRFESNIFAFLVPDTACLKDPVKLVNVLTRVMGEPFKVDGQEFFLSSSTGISFYPSDGQDARTLIRNAEAAMYRAKSESGNSFQYYAQDLNEAAREWLYLENALHRALERNELHVFYQPQVSLQDNRVTGAEALLRWILPDRGVISPETFVPLMEKTGLIYPIGEWVLRTACRQNEAWQQQGYEIETVSVNVSASQLEQPEFYHLVFRVLNETGLDPKRLELEITESVAMQDPAATVAAMQHLKAMGVRLSIDDFGTGYSSLSYLKKFPIDTLKVDQSFVRSLITNKSDALIAHAMIELAHSLGMKVIAEGVETKKQLEVLRLDACDEIQGFIFSQPITAEAFTELLLKRKNHST